MKFRALTMLVLVLVSWHVAAAPPAGGFAGLEQVVAENCQRADTVVVAQVGAVKERLGPVMRTRTGRITVLQVFKGLGRDAPPQVSVYDPINPVTDSFGMRIESGAKYVMFFSAGNLSLSLPGVAWGDAVEKVVPLAAQACSAPRGAA